MTHDTQSINLHAALQEHFEFPKFMDGQEDAVRSALEGQDLLVIMPTGSGKSLCYQLASMLLDGITIVISPLIALMKDQVDGLAARGLPATFINSSLSGAEMSERMAGLRQGTYKLVYVAPERFRNQGFLDTFKSLRVSMVAIDEAHCISQWGHDFRPDYLRIREVVADLPDARIMALTATATPDVRADIVKQLALGENGRSEPKILVYGFERPNLQLTVSRTSTHAEKLERIRAALETYDTGIVYCATRKQTKRVMELLKSIGQACCVYHGGLPDEERKAVQDRFMKGEVPVAVATNAFGMGVDRADLRFVIHWDVPGSVEAYYQEIGRAGRDGKPAHCELLYNYADVRTQEFFLQGGNPTREEIQAVWNVVRKRCLQGPVTQSLEDWTAEVDVTRNDMTVRTIMAILERAGLIERAMQPGGRTYTTSLVEGADLAALEEQLAYLALKRQRDEGKLKTMLRYVNAPACRHAFILSYFGERDVASQCSACDRCVGTVSEDARGPSEDEWLVVQKILSCVARMEGRFGAGRVAQVLMGSKNKAVIDRGLDRLSTYGLLRGCDEAYLRKLIDELIRDGCIQVSDGEYPLVAITERGGRVVQKEETPDLVWPTSRKKRKKKAVVPAAADSSDGLYDGALFEALKAWRSEASTEESVPAFVVMHDRTLKAVAVVGPKTLAELESIKGIGPSRVAKYGDAILEILDAWRESGGDRRRAQPGMLNRE